MAQIIPSTEEKIFKIQKFLGVNESPDGDTQLELGEAAIQRNWLITPEQHLKVRPGYEVLKQFDGPVRGLWSGYVAGSRQIVCAADGGLWEPLEDRRIGDIDDRPTNFFGFGGKVYIQNGIEYMSWDGDGFADTVNGYIPLVSSATKPEGGGTELENVNRLTGRRRIKFSPDGKATDFHLPEKELLTVDKVETDGKLTDPKEYTPDLKEGVVKFTAAPKAGQNTIQIWYTVPNSLRTDVESMRFAEQFNGASDTRIFLYGDGTSKAIYSGVMEDGKPSAEYFPEQYEMDVGTDNSPITGMVKNYSRLMSYKSDGGAYSTTYNVEQLQTGKATPSFETVSVHREIGNSPMGQVRLVNNVPRTLYGGNLYDWKYANSYYRDERNAKLVSQKVQATLRAADPDKIYAFDDDTNREYYLFLNDEQGTVIVQNYQTDTWYMYDSLPVVCACQYDHGDLLFGFSDGRLVRFSRRVTSDGGKAIKAYMETGNMSFDKDYKRKHSSQLWVSLLPTSHANLLVSARSDRRDDYPDKEMEQSVFDFANVDFAKWSFNTNDSPQVKRLKLKIKKFVYYKLILKSEYEASDATVLGVDIRVRYTGYVK